MNSSQHHQAKTHPWSRWVALLGLTLMLRAGGSLLAADPLLVVGAVPGAAGTAVTVPIYFLGATNAPSDVVAVQADVAFEGAQLSAGSSLAAAGLPAHQLQSFSPAPGITRLLAYSMSQQPITNGQLATLTFNVGAAVSAPVLHLSLSNVVLSTAAGTARPVSPLGGLIVLQPVVRQTNGTAAFVLAAEPAQTYRIEASTDLTTWSALATNTAPGLYLDFSDTNAPSFIRRFYRAVPLP
jgi:hypothetical protein